MRLRDYLNDKVLEIFLDIIFIIFVFLVLIAFDTNLYLIFIIIFVALIIGTLKLFYDFQRRANFYNETTKILNNLDQKYLITEIINNGSFLDSKILVDYLYEIDKSMNEKLKDYRINNEDFVEYIELWCHEIKTPIATIKMLIENNKIKISDSLIEEIDRIDNYVEQVLYYSRSNNVEKDYIIKKTNLKTVVETVIKRNKKDLINNKIKIDINDLDVYINSDKKWLEFIINQIINNSIKYKSENPIIKIYKKINKDNIELRIEDNGIGIKEEDISKVFDKGFTGENGRILSKSTGIGLYLCKKLSLKLGHDIKISSNNNTVVTIIFPIGSNTNI
ncbi:MAG: sensor histidine kinase [Bacilli bacterium]|nr:sensor histidine kinase [Bacilli bacterium]